MGQRVAKGSHVLLPKSPGSNRPGSSEATTTRWAEHPRSWGHLMAQGKDQLPVLQEGLRRPSAPS